MHLQQTERRDILIANEKRWQRQWKDDKIFESDAPSTDEIPFGSISNAEMHRKHPKFFGLMAYPYMNGTLHSGHTLTISKVEDCQARLYWRSGLAQPMDMCKDVRSWLKAPLGSEVLS